MRLGEINEIHREIILIGNQFSYRHGLWRSNTNGKDIQQELQEKYHRIEQIPIQC